MQLNSPEGPSTQVCWYWIPNSAPLIRTVILGCLNPGLLNSSSKSQAQQLPDPKVVHKSYSKHSQTHGPIHLRVVSSTPPGYESPDFGSSACFIIPGVRVIDGKAIFGMAMGFYLAPKSLYRIHVFRLTSNIDHSPYELPSTSRIVRPCRGGHWVLHSR